MITACEISAWITVDDKELGQYQVSVSPDGKEVTCWVASEAGKHFVIHVKDGSLSRRDAVSTRFTLDGIRASGSVIYPHIDKPSLELCKRTVRTSSTTEAALCFAPLELTDDDAYLERTDYVNKLGQIELDCWRAVITGKDLTRTGTARTSQKVHERLKKAGAHRVQFGEDMPCDRKAVKTKRLDKRPFARFIFRYNSLEVLRANGIVPAATGLSASADVKPKKTATTTQSTSGYSEAERIKALEAELKSLKEKQQPSNSNKRKAESARSPSKRVKPEPTNRSSGVFATKDVLDLTTEIPTRVKTEAPRKTTRVFAEEDVIDLT
ncbi:hypothetical protein JAAARDRAFT_189106 [Jaapia argillacea MUCL 33604]|uniref:DUF7918 domain-containing protein n=1 Tax=Jaapia argillacea MUCL 33604 TaxID=933084 RepID=A0A067QJ56_9AGAM|nr:hypothetical protein JAAARDRAFT_189106 [Jaapia argillacea MUCL 33604]